MTDDVNPASTGVRRVFVVICPACPDLDDDGGANTEADALDDAGAHDDAVHGGVVTAFLTLAISPPPSPLRSARKD